MELFTKLGAAVFTLLLSLPALAYQTLKRALEWTPPGLAPGKAGVVVVTYQWPGGGSGGTVTAPTGALARQVPVQTAQVFFADTDAQAVVTHNKGLGNSFPAQLYPIVVISKSLGGGSDTSFFTNFTIGKTNTNSITINKPVGTGTGGTYDVALIFGDGPWSK
jgi:hypothetical protein